MPLRIGAELVILAFLINKLTGVYGLLSVLTGYDISKLQLSMYIYSLIALALGAHLAPHIRKGPQSPIQNLALAWLYLIDSAINFCYTLAFALSWFLVLAHHTQSSGTSPPSGKATVPVGQEMMHDVAGFTNPTYTVSAVDVTVTSVAGSKPEPALIGKQGSYKGDSAGAGAVTEALLSRESLSGVATIGLLWLLRIYSIFVVLAYARTVIRQYVVIQSQNQAGYTESTPIDKDHSSGLSAENPFAKGTPAGTGWRGGLGRVMVRTGQEYWLGVDRETEGKGFDEEWARVLGDRFNAQRGHRSRTSRSSIGTSVGTSAGSFSEPQTGPGERERRRRAGTGPPPPATGLGVQTVPIDSQGRSGSVPNLRPIELDEMARK